MNEYTFGQRKVPVKKPYQKLSQMVNKFDLHMGWWIEVRGTFAASLKRTKIERTLYDILIFTRNCLNCGYGLTVHKTKKLLGFLTTCITYWDTEERELTLKDRSSCEKSQKSPNLWTWNKKCQRKKVPKWPKTRFRVTLFH